METRHFMRDKIKKNKLLDKSDFNENDDTDAESKYADLHLPDNFYLIGTVNMDETTHPFSKKVLDRAKHH